MTSSESLIELDNINENLQISCDLYEAFTTKGSFKYYHYNCDGFTDVGWGCGYRTLQTLCSWIRERKLEKNLSAPLVPSLLEIQKILHQCGDKPASFVNSKQWIGCFEASIVIDFLYDVPCDLDTGSKGILGVLECKNNLNDPFFLVADPHYSSKKADKQHLIEDGWIKWNKVRQIENSKSFYNFCMPQFK